MLTKRILTPLVAGVLLVGLTACGSDDKKSDTTEAAADDAGTSGTDAAAEPTPTDVVDATAAVTDATTGGGGGTDAGSPFCVAAQAAQDAGNAVNLDTGTPDEIEAGVNASVAAAQAAADAAPDEIKDVVSQIVDYQQQFATILEKYDWDLAKAASAPEFAALADTDAESISTQLDAYLAEHCGMTGS